MANKAAAQPESSREKAVELIATMLMQKGGALVEQARRKAEAGESLQVKGVKVDAEMLKEALLRSGALLKHSDAPKAVTSAAPSARWSPAKEATSSSRWRPAAASDMMLTSRALEECEQAEVFVRTVDVVNASDARVFPRPDVLQPPMKVQLGSGQAIVIARWYCHRDGRLYLRLKDPEGWVSSRSVHDMTVVVIAPLSGEPALEPLNFAATLPSNATSLLPSAEDTGEHKVLPSGSLAGGEAPEDAPEHEEQEAEDVGEHGEEEEEEGDEDGDEEEDDEEEEGEGDEELGEDAPPKEPAKSPAKRAPTCRFRVAALGRCFVLPYPGAAAAKRKGLVALAPKQTVVADAVAFIRSEQRAYVRLQSGAGWVCERSLADIRRYAVLPIRKSGKPVTKKEAKAIAFKGYDTGGATKLTKDDLCRNKNGKVVSKKASEVAKKRFADSSLAKWSDAVKRARADLGIVGFAAAKRGSPLYEKAQEYFKVSSSEA
mmetsp:Transcript_9309/g.16793  ORF Transcript_9309/g.16793 Transcript_9309/m.16793 type:complete len:488 (+) Transcript_9309:61-1524(+)